MKKVDPDGFGKRVDKRLEELRNRRAMHDMYELVATQVANDQLERARVAWEVFIDKYGTDFDPKEVAEAVAASVKPPSAARPHSAEPTPARDPEEAKQRNEHGDELFERREYTQAVAEYTRAIELDPNNHHYYYNRGVSYQLKGDYPRAIEDFTRFLKIYPNGIVVYRMRANLYKSSNNYTRAVDDFTHLIQCDPNSGYFYYERSKVYGLMHGKTAERKRDLRRAADLGYAQAIEELKTL